MKKKSGWTENTKQKGIQEPRKKWDERCNWCAGRGMVSIYHPRFKWIKCEKCDGRKD